MLSTRIRSDLVAKATFDAEEAIARTVALVDDDGDKVLLAVSTVRQMVLRMLATCYSVDNIEMGNGIADLLIEEIQALKSRRGAK